MIRPSTFEALKAQAESQQAMNRLVARWFLLAELKLKNGGVGNV